jgi:hypothetical protein
MDTLPPAEHWSRPETPACVFEHVSCFVRHAAAMSSSPIARAAYTTGQRIPSNQIFPTSRKVPADRSAPPFSGNTISLFRIGQNLHIAFSFVQLKQVESVSIRMDNRSAIRVRSE